MDVVNIRIGVGLAVVPMITCTPSFGHVDQSERTDCAAHVASARFQSFGRRLDPAGQIQIEDRVSVRAASHTMK